MVRRGSGLGAVVLVFTATFIISFPRQALGACHVATFDENQVVVDEPGGEAVVVVELDGTGPVNCTGTIRWKTADRTAKAPADYRASQGELKWNRGSPRRQTITVPIVDDSVAEPAEVFTVTMTAGPGDIKPEEAAAGQGGPTAIVRIRDDETVETPSPSASTPAATESPTPRPTEPTGESTSTGGGGSTGGLIAGIVGGLVLLGGMAAVLIRRRAGT